VDTSAPAVRAPIVAALRTTVTPADTGGLLIRPLEF
jgi:hypothetical protein